MKHPESIFQRGPFRRVLLSHAQEKRGRERERLSHIFDTQFTPPHIVGPQILPPDKARIAHALQTCPSGIDMNCAVVTVDMKGSTKHIVDMSTASPERTIVHSATAPLEEFTFRKLIGGLGLVSYTGDGLMIALVQNLFGQGKIELFKHHISLPNVLGIASSFAAHVMGERVMRVNRGVPERLRLAITHGPGVIWYGERTGLTFTGKPFIYGERFQRSLDDVKSPEVWKHGWAIAMQTDDRVAWNTEAWGIQMGQLGGKNTLPDNPDVRYAVLYPTQAPPFFPQTIDIYG